jgi:hypothetical protein
VNDSYETHVINMVKILADEHGCRLADIDPENQVIRLEGCRDKAKLSRKLADLLGG